MDRVPRELPGASAPGWLRALPWAVLAAVLAGQLLTPETVQLGFAFAVVPPLASLAYGMLGTALVSVVLMGLLALPKVRAEHLSPGDLLALGLIGAVSVLLAWARQRREAQLVTVRTVAEAAQYAVLPPLPPRVGPVRCGALYRAAVRTALVGGDLYDVQPGPYGVRAIVADVKGHGLSAVSTVAALLGTFREAVLDEPELTGVAARLDRRLVVDSSRQAETELFATAVLVEFPEEVVQAGGPGGDGGRGGDGREDGEGGEGGEDGQGGRGGRDGGTGSGPEVVARVLSCGHPPPVVVTRAGGSEVELESCPPLGLGVMEFAAPEPVSVPLDPSCVLLVYTDGVTEARDADGAFYPLCERLRPELDPVALVRWVWRDVSAYTGEIADDVALLALRVNPGG
ncbi:PP2C family protein-serine/threonine phosphatase [Streptomyces sp. enrichment culture]|uniref:PP2C family protein-serine/threonine phosphatase n=1 Tax=Streptomyces sp. enrichment culture TaxID=1795815 RepID=UPI003F572594